MRRIVFVGNCQVQALSQLYERFSGREEWVVYLPSYEDLSAEAAEQISAADVLVEQRMDVAPRAEPGKRIGRDFGTQLACWVGGRSRVIKSRTICAP